MAGSTISTTVSVLDGVTLGSGGYSSPLTITSTGGIAPFPNLGHATGLSASISIGYVLNQGVISGENVISDDGGFIQSGGNGVDLADGSITNDGTVTGGYGYFSAAFLYIATGGAGLNLTGGSLTNFGTITGGQGGATGGWAGGVGVNLAGGSLNNHGMIAGGIGYYGGRGVDLTGGSLTNEGTIIGGIGSASDIGPGTGGVGVYFSSGGTLTDAGFVGGGSDAGVTADAVSFGSGASQLILGAGASFGGAVVANASFSNVLELSTGGSVGLIAGLGDTVTGFGTIQFDPGTHWLIEGNAAGIADGQTIDGFTLGNTIELTGFIAKSDTFTGAGLVLAGTSGSATIGIKGAFTTPDFIITNDGTNSFVELACFAAGTRISGEHRDIAVEALQVGETIQVLLGNGVAPITWIGRRVVNCASLPRPRLAWPVRIAVDAFGEGRPCRDLFLSPDHAVFVGDVLIPVKYLVNGSTIVQTQMDEVTYYHIQLPRHSILLAEGLAVESYLRIGDQKNFANGNGPVALHPDFASRVWDADGCAPLVVSGPILESVRHWLDAMAGSILVARQRKHEVRKQTSADRSTRHRSAGQCIPRV